jgi:hypothetical protein
MTALEYFRVVAKQFASMDDPEVNVWLNIASMNAHNCLIGDQANLAQALYAAHMLQLDSENQAGQGGRGNITSEKEGDLSRSYESSVSKDGWLDLSGYGQQYANMIVGCFGGGIMTRFDINNMPISAAPYADDVVVFSPPRNLY